jgi:CheY-like chemotaxis protein
MDKPTTVFIIDDDLIYQFAVKRILSAENKSLNVYSFGDGEEAIEFINNNKQKQEAMPDIILLDINMPIMDGWQFLDEYAQIKQELKKKSIIYMVSSSVDPVDSCRAAKIEEVKSYLIKPLNSAILKQVIESFEKAA